MTREPDPIETQIRGLIGFHCADQAAFTEMVAWLDRTASRLEHLEAENAKLNAKEAETWDRILFERRLFNGIFASDDKREGMSAFVDKRKADWKGR